jgi:hypothetical protein
MVYAMYDTFVTANNPGFGFCNTKCAVAFINIKKLNEFLKLHSYDYSAKRISRDEARKYAWYILDTNDRGIEIWNKDENFPDYFENSIKIFYKGKY